MRVRRHHDLGSGILSDRITKCEKNFLELVNTITYTTEE